MRAVALLCCVLAVSAAPAEAAVESSSPSGFSIRHELVLRALSAGQPFGEHGSEQRRPDRFG